MGRTVWGLSPDGREIFCSHPEWLQGPPNLLYNECQVSFPVLKQLMHGINHPLHLAMGIEKEYCYNSILSLGLHGLLQAESDFLKSFMIVVIYEISFCKLQFDIGELLILINNS
jgi:hypothetical protein